MKPPPDRSGGGDTSKGAMPRWIHDRADHIQRRNPDMDKSMAFAIATQQAHAMNKSPKKYGTPEGRKAAKKKYPATKGWERTADKTATMNAYFSEICKLALASPLPVPKPDVQLNTVSTKVPATGTLTPGSKKFTSGAKVHSIASPGMSGLSMPGKLTPIPQVK